MRSCSFWGTEKVCPVATFNREAKKYRSVAGSARANPTGQKISCEAQVGNVLPGWKVWVDAAGGVNGLVIVGVQ